MDDQAVVVKAAFAVYEYDWASRLREGVRTYSERKQLQGRSIPCFYSFVKGLAKPKTRRMLIREPHIMVICIIIEDCDEDVSSFSYLDWKESYIRFLLLYNISLLIQVQYRC